MNTAHNSLFKPTDRILRQFAALWIAFFGLIGARQELRYQHHVAAAVIVVLALTVGPIGLVWPRAIKPVFVGWMALTYPVGWVVSRIVLGGIFYGLFTPLGWVFRLLGRDSMELKPKPNATTYWQKKLNPTDREQYLRQF